jgi:hypothetical protein
MSSLRARSAAPRVRYRRTFDRAARRRREIEWHARDVGAADSDDLSRWLIAWIWHNPHAKDQVGAVMECARRIGRKGFTVAAAAAVIKEASHTRRCMSADDMADYLGVTWDQRKRLGLTTIGATNMRKRERKILRWIKNKMAKERKRRDRGTKPQSQSLSRIKPWEDLNMSRRQWYRKRNGTTSGTAVLLTYAADKVVPSAAPQASGCPMKGYPPAETLPPGQGVIDGMNCTTLAVPEPMPGDEKKLRGFDISVFSTLPIELRMASLGL